MATMIVKIRVANFESWKRAFDAAAPLRAKHGFVGHEILRDASDPNVVTVVNRVRDLAGAKAYGGSAELRQAMQSGGVQGPPEVSFLEEVEQSAPAAAAQFGLIHHFKGGTQEQYASALRAAHPDGGESLPPGQLFHIGGKTPEGWFVLALWDTQANWERFRDQVLFPGLAKAEGSFTAPPDEITFKVARVQQG